MTPAFSLPSDLARARLVWLVTTPRPIRSRPWPDRRARRRSAVTSRTWRSLLGVGVRRRLPRCGGRRSGVQHGQPEPAALAGLLHLSSFPVAIAYDGAGDIAAGTTNNPPSPDLYIYPAGATTAVNAYSLGTLSTLGGILAPRGLGWLPDGSQVFGVLNRITSYALAVVANPTVPQPDPPARRCTARLGRRSSSVRPRLAQP